MPEKDKLQLTPALKDDINGVINELDTTNMTVEQMNKAVDQAVANLTQFTSVSGVTLTSGLRQIESFVSQTQSIQNKVKQLLSGTGGNENISLDPVMADLQTKLDQIKTFNTQFKTIQTKVGRGTMSSDTAARSISKNINGLGGRVNTNGAQPNMQFIPTINPRGNVWHVGNNTSAQSGMKFDNLYSLIRSMVGDVKTGVEALSSREKAELLRYVKKFGDVGEVTKNGSTINPMKEAIKLITLAKPGTLPGTGRNIAAGVLDIYKSAGYDLLKPFNLKAANINSDSMKSAGIDNFIKSITPDAETIKNLTSFLDGSYLTSRVKGMGGSVDLSKQASPYEMIQQAFSGFAGKTGGNVVSQIVNGKLRIGLSGLGQNPHTDSGVDWGRTVFKDFDIPVNGIAGRMADRVSLGTDLKSVTTESLRELSQFLNLMLDDSFLINFLNDTLANARRMVKHSTAANEARISPDGFKAEADNVQRALNAEDMKSAMGSTMRRIIDSNQIVMDKTGIRKNYEGKFDSNKYNDRDWENIYKELHDYSVMKAKDILAGNKGILFNSKDIAKYGGAGGLFEHLNNDANLMEMAKNRAAILSKFTNLEDSSMSEEAYIDGRISGMGANAMLPFYGFNSATGDNRSLSQSKNIIHRNAKSKQAMEKLGGSASAMYNPLYKEMGLDYDSAELSLINIGRHSGDASILEAYGKVYGQASDSLIFESLKYHGLNTKGFKYDTNTLQFADSSLRGSAIKALLRELAPAIDDGGAIASQGLMLAMSGYRTGQKVLTAEQLRQMGIKELGALPGIGDSIRLGANGAGLKLGRGVKAFQGIEPGMILKSITGLEDGTFQVGYDTKMEGRSFKTITGGGNRSETVGETNDIFQLLMKELGFNPEDNIQMLAGRRGESARKFMPDIQGKYDYLFNKFAEAYGGTRGQAYGKINDLIQGSDKLGMLQDFLGFDKDVGKFTPKVSASHGGMFSFLDNQIGKNGITSRELAAGFLNNFASQDGAYGILAQLMDETLGKGGAFTNSVMNPNKDVTRTYVNRADEYSYFSPVAGGSRDYIADNGHFKITNRDIEALNNMYRRQRGIAKSAGLNNSDIDAFVRGNNAWSFAGEGDKALDARRANIKAASNYMRFGSGEQYGMDNPEVGLNGLLGYLSDIAHVGQYIMSGDYDATILGAADRYASQPEFRQSKFMQMNLAKDLEKMGFSAEEIEENFHGGRFATPVMGSKADDEGMITPESEMMLVYNQFVRTATQLKGETDKGKVARLKEQLKQDYANINTTLNNSLLSKGIYAPLENYAQHSMAAKAVATNAFGNIGANTTVMNTEDLLKMVGIKGENNAANNTAVNNIKTWMRDEFSSNADAANPLLKAFGLLGKDGKLDESAFSSLGNNGLGSLLTRMIDSGTGFTSLQGLLKRYPLITGNDLRATNIKTSNLLESGTYATDKGLSYGYHGDFDGDTGYLALNWLQAKDAEDLRKSLNVQREETNRQTYITNQQRKSYIESEYTKDANGNYAHKDDAGFSQDQISENIDKVNKAAFGDDSAYQTVFTSLMAKRNKGNTGKFSNAADYISRGIGEKLENANGIKGIQNAAGLTEIGDNEFVQSIYKTLFRMPFTVAEDQSISAKKIGGIIENQLKAEGRDPAEGAKLTVAEAENKFFKGYDDFYKLETGKDGKDIPITDPQFWTNYLEHGQKLGIFGENGLGAYNVTEMIAGVNRDIMQRAGIQTDKEGNVVTSGEGYAEAVERYKTMVNGMGLNGLFNLNGIESGDWGNVIPELVSSKNIANVMATISAASGLDYQGLNTLFNAGRKQAQGGYRMYSDSNTNYSADGRWHRTADGGLMKDDNGVKTYLNTDGTIDIKNSNVTKEKLLENIKNGEVVLGVNDATTSLYRIAEVLTLIAEKATGAEAALTGEANASETYAERLRALSIDRAANDTAKRTGGDVSMSPISVRAREDGQHGYIIDNPEDTSGVESYTKYSITGMVGKILGSEFNNADSAVIREKIDNAQLNGEIINPSDHGITDSQIEGFKASALGTVVHEEQEAVQNAINGISTFKNSSAFENLNPEQLEAFNAATEEFLNPQNTDINGLANLMSKLGGVEGLPAIFKSAGMNFENYFSPDVLKKYTDAVQAYTSDMTTLGFNEDAINRTLNYGHKFTRGTQQNLMSGLFGKNIATEQAIGTQFVDGQGNVSEVGGAIDNLYYDPETQTMNIVDYKTGGKITAENVYQQNIYKDQLRTRASAVKNLLGQLTGNDVTGLSARQFGLTGEDGSLNYENIVKAYRGELGNDAQNFIRGVDKKGLLLFNPNNDIAKEAELLQAHNEVKDVQAYFAHGNDKGEVAFNKIESDMISLEEAVSQFIEILKGATEPLKVKDPEKYRNIPNAASKIDSSNVGKIVRDAVEKPDEDANKNITSSIASKPEDFSKDINSFFKTLAQINKIQERALLYELKAQNKNMTQEQRAALNKSADAEYERARLLEAGRQNGSATNITKDENGNFVVYGRAAKPGEEAPVLTTIRKDDGLGGVSQQWSDMQKRFEMQNNEYSALIQNIRANAVAAPGGSQKGFIGDTLQQLPQTFKYLTRTSIVYAIIAKIKQAFSTMIKTIQSLNKEVTNLSIITKQSTSAMYENLSTYNQMAGKFGKTTAEVTQAAQDWLRAGYSISESNKLIESSLKLSTLGMIDSKEATKDLISTMKGWKLQAEDMDDVVDNLTALDVKFATTSGDIATAMAKGNVSANLAGIDLEDYEAYITTILDTSQQEAGSVGTAMKTLMSRFGTVKAGKFSKTYSDSDSDEDALGATALNDVETVLNKIGIQTRSTVGNFRDMNDVLEEIAGKWGSLDLVSQNAITTALAGTRQRESLNVLFENWDKVGKAKDVIESSSGSADEKMGIYGSSIEAAKNRMTAAVEGAFSAPEFASLMTKLIDTGTNLIKGLKGVAISAAAIALYVKRDKVGKYIGDRWRGDATKMAGYQMRGFQNYQPGQEKQSGFARIFGAGSYNQAYFNAIDQRFTEGAASYTGKYANNADTQATTKSIITNMGANQVSGIFGNDKASGSVLRGMYAKDMDGVKGGLSAEEARTAAVDRAMLTDEEAKQVEQNVNDAQEKLQEEQQEQQEELEKRQQAIADKRARLSSMRAEKQTMESSMKSLKDDRLAALLEAESDREFATKLGPEQLEELKNTPVSEFNGKNISGEQMQTINRKGNVEDVAPAAAKYLGVEEMRGQIKDAAANAELQEQYAAQAGHAIQVGEQQIAKKEEEIAALESEIQADEEATAAFKEGISKQGDLEVSTEGLSEAQINYQNAIKNATDKQRNAIDTTGRGIQTSNHGEALTTDEGDTLKGVVNDENVAKYGSRTGGINMGAVNAAKGGLSMVNMYMTSQGLGSLAKEVGADEDTLAIASTVTTMLPMIANMIPGIPGLIVQSIIGLGNLFAMVYNKGHRTQEEILENAKKDAERNKKIADKIQDLESGLNETEDQQGRYNELVKGVSSVDGSNISLNNSEWQEYQNIIQTMIKYNDNLYASYDQNGDVLLRCRNGVLDLNAAMEETIAAQKELIRREKLKMAWDSESVAGQVYNALHTTIEEVAGLAGEASLIVKNSEWYDHLTQDEDYIGPSGLKIKGWKVQQVVNNMIEGNNKTKLAIGSEGATKLSDTQRDYLNKIFAGSLVTSENFNSHSGAWEGDDEIHDITADKLLELMRNASNDDELEALITAFSDRSDINGGSNTKDTTKNIALDFIVNEMAKQVRSERESQEALAEARKYSNEKDSKYYQVQQTLIKSMGSAMVTALESSEIYVSLDEQSLAFLKNVFSNIQFNPLNSEGKFLGEDAAGAWQTDGTKEDIEAMYTLLYRMQLDMLLYLSGEGSGLLQGLAQFNNNDATLSEDIGLRENFLSLFRNVGSMTLGNIEEILAGQGYDTSAFHEYFSNGSRSGEELEATEEAKRFNMTWNELINSDYAEWVRDIITPEKLKSSRDKIVESIQKNYSNTADQNILDSLTGLELQVLNKESKGEFADIDWENITLSELRTRIRNASINGESSASESWAVLKQNLKDLGYTVNTTTESIDALHSAMEKDPALANEALALKNLTKIAETLGTTLENVVENISLIDIDAYGHTTKTLSEIKQQFDDISGIVTDLTSNKMLSMDNLSKLLELSADSVNWILEGADSIMSHMDDMLSIYYTLASAVFKTAADSNETWYNNQLGSLVDSGTIHSSKGKLMKIFGTAGNAKKASDIISEHGYDEAGNKNDKYWTVEEGKEFDSGHTTIYNDLADVFGIDYSKNTTEASENLKLKLVDNMIAAGYKKSEVDQMSLLQLVTYYGNSGHLGSSLSNYLDAKSQYDSLIATRDVMEKEALQQAVSDAMSELSTQYSNGTLSMENYIASLENLRDSGAATEEQLRELNETIEDTKLALISYQYDNAALSVDNYRNSLSELIKLNAKGSSDDTDLVSKYLATFDDEVEKALSLMNMLPKYDISGRLSASDMQMDAAIAKRNAIIASKMAAGATKEQAEQSKDVLKQDEEILNLERQRLAIFDDMNSMIDTLISVLGEYSTNTIASLQNQQLDNLYKKRAEIERTLGVESEEYFKVQEDIRKNLESQYNTRKKEIDLLEKRGGRINTNDFQSREVNLMQRKQKILENLERTARELGTDSEEFQETLQDQYEIQKEILELEKEQYEYRIQKAEDYFGDYNTIADYQIALLNNLKDTINDVYNDEIARLEEVNEAKKRTIELTKLQNALDSARKEKSRVYVAGVGWTYQEDQNKTAEAKENLLNFEDEQKIADLKNAQEKEIALIDEVIEDWEDVKTIVDLAKQLADAETAVQNLIDTGFLQEGSTIQNAMTYIMGEAARNADGAIVGLNSDFQTIKENYIVDKKGLLIFNDTEDERLRQLDYDILKAERAMNNKFGANTTAINSANTSNNAGNTNIYNKLNDIYSWITNNATGLGKALSDLSSNIAGSIKGGPDASATLASIQQAIEAAKASMDAALAELMAHAPQYTMGGTTKTDGSWSQRVEGSRVIGYYLTKDGKKATSMDDVETKVQNHTLMYKVKYNTGEEGWTTQTFNANGMYDKYENGYNVWINEMGQPVSNVNDVLSRDINGVKYWAFKNTVTGLKYWTPKDPKYYGHSVNYGTGYAVVVNEGVDYGTIESFSTGIENGPVTTTGLAMLHGTSNSPEYVLNNDQAYTLLKNLSTMSLQPTYDTPQIDSKANTSGDISSFVFNGDINLPNVQNPSTFFDELMNTANRQFDISKTYYK